MRKAERHGHQFLILHRNDTILSQLQIPDGPGSVLSPLSCMCRPHDPVLEQSVLKRCCLPYQVKRSRSAANTAHFYMSAILNMDLRFG